MDPDSPWEENPDFDHAPEAEWTRITSEFTNSGYREGIVAGKEAFLQEGFDTGFASVGAPLGRDLGNLRGIAAAIRSLLQAQSPESPDFEEIRNISSILSTIQFSDVAPRDREAEQHAKEHSSFDDLVTENAESGAETTKDVAKLKERLNLLCTQLGLTDLA